MPSSSSSEGYVHGLASADVLCNGCLIVATALASNVVGPSQVQWALQAVGHVRSSPKAAAANFLQASILNTSSLLLAGR